MKYLDEFRNSVLAQHLVRAIRRSCTRRWTIMEVCGGQTHGLLRYGIEEELQNVVELVHGPGCPVCVTPREAIDLACRLALEPKVLLASFGDMLRVPGSRESLQAIAAAGGNVQPVYSPADAVDLARRNPRRDVVFFAVGFETTAPATALAILQAEQLGLTNFSLLVSHVRVQPAMEAIAEDPVSRVEGFLAAGHVCTVAGCESYKSFVMRHGLPVVVTGFEPLDLLQGIRACIRQLEAGTAAVVNQYARSVLPQGNLAAQQIVERVYEVCDRPWRGLGVIPAGGLRLREEWARFDAEQRYGRQFADAEECSDCRSGDVLSGRIKPPECPHFATLCNPDNPLGAPMVSSEGACAAYYRYRRQPLALRLEGAGA
ncbi:MAG TPA: hydrogenase formation protein HypD [Pirellulaceae bacterium]|nr:hydrogenase formation protein HypD [Pirellulaceae bacterium]